MRNTLKRLLAVLLTIALLFSLSAAVFADGEEQPAPAAGDPAPAANDPAPAANDPAPAANDPAPAASDPAPQAQKKVVPIKVQLSLKKLSLKTKESVDVTANVKGADAASGYKWYSTDSKVVEVSGSGAAAKITAVGAGKANVALTVESQDGRSGYGYLDVTVTATSTPVSVKGGSAVSLDEGERKNLSASVSGGSGSYEYSWDTDGSGVVALEDNMRGNATVLAGRTGSGSVILTVYDAEDRTNNASTTWNFTVKDKPTVAPELQMNRGSVDIGAGGTGTLMLSATGGSGDYEYIWRSDNAGAVSVSGNGANAEIRAASTVLPSSNRAEISACVRDRKSGLMSNTVSCVVTVSAGSTTYNATDSAKVGDYVDFGPLANRVSDAFKQSFGSAVNGSASVRFTNPSSSAGAIRFQDGTPVKGGTSYSFDIFRTLLFSADQAGSFRTAYMVSDSGNTIEGSISFTVSGGVSVTSVTLDKNTIRIPTFSSASLAVSVTPSVGYSVEWSTSDAYIVTVNGSGNKVRLETNCNSGNAKVTATVTDSNGVKTACTCNVTVESTSTSARSQNVTFDTSLTVSLGSDDNTSKLAESMISKFRNAFNAYPTEADTIIFSSLGNSRYGTIRTRDGSAAAANRAYSFRDWVDMYFAPVAAGTFLTNYQFRHGSRTVNGTIRIAVQASSLTVVMTPAALRMAPYSSQYLTLSIQPATGYRVKWSSSNPAVATATGSNTTAVINSLAAGTTTVTAAVTDSRGIETRRSCTVLVGSDAGSFDPSVSTTLGIPYVGTGTSTAMRSQFTNLYNMTLQDNAIIRFASTGNTDVAVMRLKDGSSIRAGVDYTLAQYVDMYTQPIAQGTYSVPYTLTYSGKALNGTVSVMVSAANISTDVKLPSDQVYNFSDPIGRSTGGKLLSESIRNTVGSNWSYVRFGSVSADSGTLYANKNKAAITPTSNVDAAAMAQLCFVPSKVGGLFTAPYTVYASNGSVVATGSLNLTPPGSGFSDVPASAYYAQAVKWAVDRGITSGVSNNSFAPATVVTRGQAVTFLWRVAGQPKATTATNPFTDVKTDAYYYHAVLWAVQQGITNGTSETTFSPDAQLNRDQLLTFLCRASGSYADGANWSQMAVNWANAHGLLAGVPGAFTAASACPRSDVVYYIWKNYSV